VGVDPRPSLADETRMIICGVVVGLLYLAFHLAHRVDEADLATETD
jgi:hypothetical protein